MANIRQATTIEKPVVRRSSAKKVFFIVTPILHLSFKMKPPAVV